MPFLLRRKTLGLAALLLILACTSRRGLEPKPVNYNIYVTTGGYYPGGEQWRDVLYVYDADSLELLDSIPLSWMPAEMAVSPDGRSIFLHGNHLRLNNAGLDTVWRIPTTGTGMEILDRGRLILYGQDWLDGSPFGYSGWLVVNTEDGSIVRTLPDSLHIGKAPIEGTEVAATVLDSHGVYIIDTIVTVIDVVTGETRGRYIPHVGSSRALEVRYVRLHPDRTTVLALGVRSAGVAWFLVGDLQTGETLFEHRLSYYYGEVAVSADGAMAVVTDPSKPFIWDSPRTVDIFNLDEMRHLKRFTVYTDINRASKVRFLPDDRTIVTAPMRTGPLQVIDLNTLTVTDSVYMPFNGYIGALGLGPRPR